MFLEHFPHLAEVKTEPERQVQKVGQDRQDRFIILKVWSNIPSLKIISFHNLGGWVIRIKGPQSLKSCLIRRGLKINC